MNKKLLKESLFINLKGKDRLHLQRFFLKDQLGDPVFMLHGSIENGRIFYSKNNKGLAPFLAKKGYDVYVADLRGRGLSTPSINRRSRFGQTQAITQDIPAFINAIIKKRGKIKQHWIAHSWGGVLMASYLARFKEHQDLVKSMVCFGTKRTISVQHLEKFLIMDIFWGPVARLLVKIFGYLPIKLLGMGPENESNRFHQEIRQWVNPKAPWVDPQDGFDYGAAIASVKLPPTLHLTGCADSFLGNPKDVCDFIKETKVKNYTYRVLGKEQGHLHNYGHTDILTHPDAVRDVFPLVIQWLEKGALKT